jgi:iron complex transport system ATP-binding protein
VSGPVTAEEKGNGSSVERLTGVGLEAAGLCFGFAGHPLFDGLSMQVEAGEMLGVIGANGSGKTTLLRLASGVLKPSGGSLTVAGRPVAGIPPRERAARIGVVPQESRLTFDFSVLEVVLMGRAAHWGLLGAEGPADRRAVHKAMTRTGTLKLAGRSIGHLSGGERQLVFVARALAQEPGLLLLDEPTAFLDIKHRMQVYNVLLEMNRTEGLTVILTSHDINFAARFCPRLVLLKQGRIVADGPTAEVFTESILGEVYETDLRVIDDPVTGGRLAVPAVPAGPV